MFEELTKEEISLNYDLYLIYCDREETHPSLSDFMVWYQERT